MRHAALLLGALALVGCQNWDLMRPEPTGASSGERSFTRLDPDEPGPLTGVVARARVEEIRSATGSERLELIDGFFDDFPEARLLGTVHSLAGEGHLAEDDPAAAAVSFQRAVELARTDLLGVPLDAVLPLQIGMSLLAGGPSDTGFEWLWRAYLVDRSDRVRQALRWAYAESGTTTPFAEWLRDGLRGVTVVAPGFDLPGLQQERVELATARSKATLLNFWSPT